MATLNSQVKVFHYDLIGTLAKKKYSMGQQLKKFRVKKKLLVQGSYLILKMLSNPQLNFNCSQV